MKHVAVFVLAGVLSYIQCASAGANNIKACKKGEYGCVTTANGAGPLCNSGGLIEGKCWSTCRPDPSTADYATSCWAYFKSLNKPTYVADATKYCGGTNGDALGTGGAARCYDPSRDGTALLCCKVGSDGVSGQDPLIWGMMGQHFKFDGVGDGWYAYISEPEFQANTRFTRFDYCEGCGWPKADMTYYTGFGMSFMSEDGAQDDQEVLIDVIDVTKHRPGCTETILGEGRDCLGDGSIRITIDGVEHTKPGEYQLANGGKIYAFNSHIYCSPGVVHDPKTHRKMFVENESIHDILPRYSTMSNLCDGWFAERKMYGDLYTLPTTSKDDQGWTTIYIETPTFSFRIGTRQEQYKGQCHRHWFDIWMNDYPDNDEVWSGIMGETKQIRRDNSGDALPKREALRGEDADYVVDGPFGRHFRARMH